MRRPRFRAAASGLAVGVLLALPGTASASTTFGANLSLAPVFGSCLAFPCTVASTTPIATHASPVDGVIVRWRVREINGTQTQLVLTVIRPAAAGAFAFVGNGPPQRVPPSPDSVLTFATQQSIKTGDMLAVSILGPGNPVMLTNPNQPGVTFVRWDNGLAAGESRAPDGVFAPPASETLMNADVEPDCDSDGLGDETQDPDTSACNPVTTITSHPKSRTAKRKATFAFTANKPGLSFQCALDSARFAACTSPDRVKVKKGPHHFAVRAMGPTGHIGEPATYSWRVVKAKK
jgi:hypothetical protein